MLEKKENILVTGGSGMVGNAMQSLLPEADYPKSYEMDFFHEHDLSKYGYVINLAGRVGGLEANTNFIADFCYENLKINKNILNSAKNSNVKKVISLLSTCVYPRQEYINYPLTEEQLHLGPPHHSNFGYAHAKRMVDVMSRAYRKQYGCNFITAIPNNLYGENDNYDVNNSHVVPALMKKVWEAKINNLPSVVCWGDGSCLREFTYSGDVAKVMLFLLDRYEEGDPINIGCTKEYSIKQLISIICDHMKYDGKIVWDTSRPSGQHRKPSSNKKLLDLGWQEGWYTSLEDGLQKTCNWFINNYPNVRGVK